MGCGTSADALGGDASRTTSSSSKSSARTQKEQKEAGLKTVDILKEVLKNQKFPPPCAFGLACYRRNPEHFVETCHPDDDHYVFSIRQHETKGQFLTLRQCFRYADPFKKGFIDDKILLSQLLDQLGITFTAKELKAMWDSLDEDGEGMVHFSEFVDWAVSGRGPAALKALPVGMEEEKEDVDSKDFSVTLSKKNADDKWGLDLLGKGTDRMAAQIKAVKELGLAHQWNSDIESKAVGQRVMRRDDWIVSVNQKKGTVNDLLEEFQCQTCEFVVHPRDVVVGLECKFVSKKFPHGCPCKGYTYNPEYPGAHMCTCGHKHGMHVRTSDSTATACPAYWTIHTKAGSASMNRMGMCPVGHTLKEIRRESKMSRKKCGGIAELGECLSGLTKAEESKNVKLFGCRREGTAEEDGRVSLRPPTPGGTTRSRCEFVVCEKCRDFRVMLEGMMDGDAVTMKKEIKSAEGLMLMKGWRGKVTQRQFENGQVVSINVLIDQPKFEARILRSSFAKLDVEKATGPRWVDCEPEVVSAVQQVVNMSKKKIWTRDRGKQKVPLGFDVVKVKRNENLPIWKKYSLRRAMTKASVLKRASDDDPSGGPEFKAYRVTTSYLNSNGFMKPEPLDESVNEWWLWHGTTIEGARAICEVDFKQKYAGSQTGSLYGKGVYFAESFTKADEYAGQFGEGDDTEKELLVMLLCRVVGGRVNYTSEDTPDPQILAKSVVHGSYDSVLGDREKLKGTFREFIIYNNDQAYPEYIVLYRRKFTDQAHSPPPLGTTSSSSTRVPAPRSLSGSTTPRADVLVPHSARSSVEPTFSL